MTITMLVVSILLLVFVQRPIFAGYLECSDEYFADYQIYGPCIAQECGRFVAQLPEDYIGLIEQIADDIYYSDQAWEEIENSTVTTVDLSTRKINFDKTVTKQLQTNDKFQDLSEFMVDIVGHHIRKKVRHLFDLKGRLWVAR